MISNLAARKTAVTKDGQPRVLDLGQPLSLLNLGDAKLDAVFNHPAINRRAWLARIVAPGDGH